MIYAELRPDPDHSGRYILTTDKTDIEAQNFGLSQEGPEELGIQSGFFPSAEEAIFAVKKHLGIAFELLPVPANLTDKAYVVNPKA